MSEEGEGDDALLDSRVTELIERGLERYTRGDMEGALSDWEHAMVLDPECVRARNYADYVRNYFSPATDGRSDVARPMAAPAIELDVPFGVELVGTKTELDLEPYEAMEMERGANGRLERAAAARARADASEALHQRFDTSDDTTAAFRAGYSSENEKQTVKIQRETMESERETPWRPGAIDDGWAFESAPTKMYRDGGASLARADSSADLESAIEDVTAGLMAIHDSAPIKLSSSVSLHRPGDPADDLVRTQAGDADPTMQRPVKASAYDGLDLADFDRDMGDVAEPPATVHAAEADGDLELDPPGDDDDADGDDDELELEVIDYPPVATSPETANEDNSAIRPGQRVVFNSERPAPPVQISFRAPDRSKPRIDVQAAAGTSDPLDNLDLDGLDGESGEPAPEPPAASKRPPTEDPSIQSAGITVDEALLSFETPTSEHASGTPAPDPMRDGGAKPAAEPATKKDRTRGRELTDVGLYDDIAGDILNELDSGPSSETREERTRRRVAALIDRAATENRDGDHARAVIALDLALQEDPESAVAQKVIHRHRDLLLDIYKNYFGNLDQVPALAVPMHELKLHELNHRAAFLLSRVDGVLSLEDILDICGMSRLEAFRHLARLMLQGILETRA